jgi:hypothetical protein
MALSEQYTRQLSASQKEFVGTLLTDIVVDGATNKGPFNDAEHFALLCLFRSIEDHPLRQSLMRGLHPSAQVTLIQQLSEPECVHMVLYSSSEDLICEAFKSLSERTQKEVLQTLYSKARKRYRLLKPFASDRLQMVGGILLTQENVLKKFVRNETEDILNKIQDSKVTLKEMASFSSSYGNEYEIEDIEFLLIKLINNFLHLKLRLETKEQFASYLKLLVFIAPYYDSLPQIKPYISDIISAVLTGIRHMPSSEWRVKLLNQLPSFALDIAMENIKQPKPANRSKFAALVKDIKQFIDQPIAENIRASFGKF